MPYTLSCKVGIPLVIDKERKMKLVSEKGYIGIFVPIKYFYKPIDFKCATN